MGERTAAEKSKDSFNYVGGLGKVLVYILWGSLINLLMFINLPKAPLVLWERAKKGSRHISQENRA